MKKQKRQYWLKKILTTTLIFSGIFLIVFNINFGFLQNNFKSNFLIEKCYAGNQLPGSVNAGQAKASPISSKKSEKVSSVNGYKPWNWPAVMAYGILKAIAIMISGLVRVIEFSLSPEFVNKLFDSSAIYTGWKTVRDTLNIMFIFFLLFSAFSTIFQVSKYHIKSTWVMIVVMALLVNFSWPITRVIIDFSNVSMDYVLGSKDGSEVASSGLMGKLFNETDFFEMMIGTTLYNSKEQKINLSEDGILSALIIGIAVGAIFLFTIGAIAILLLIRVVFMAVLLVFASAGFVFAAFPSTRSTSSKWWSALLDQAILGPVVLFALLLAVGVMEDVSNLVPDTTAIGQLKMLPQYAVAIILIWTGILAAKSISGQTAGMAMGAANKVKGKALAAGKWGGKKGLKFGDYGMAVATNKAASSDRKWLSTLGKGSANLRTIPDRVKNISKKGEKKYNDALGETKARALETGGWGGDKYAMKNINQKKINEKMKENENKGTDVLADKLKNASGTELVALVKSLEKRDDVIDKEMEKLAKVMDKLDDTMQKTVIKKAKDTGNAHTVMNAASKIEEKRIADKAGVDVSALSAVQRNDARKSASAKIYNGMDGKTFAKQRETIKQIEGGNMDFQHAGIELQQKLNRVGFARDMQHVDSETYGYLENINGDNL